MNDQTFRGLVRVAKSQVRLLKRRVAKTVDFQGIAVKVDRPQGHVQRGKDAQGNSWERTYKVDYGYITGTQGGDGEGLDVYLGPSSSSPLAYWIHQRKSSGEFDEYKLMLGFPDRRSAKAMWSAHTPERFYGGIATTSVGLVKALLGLEPHSIAKAIALQLAKDDRSTASLLLEAGPPHEWSGAVASILGAVGRARVNALWAALSAEHQELAQRTWEAGMAAPEGVAPSSIAHVAEVERELLAKYPALAKRDRVARKAAVAAEQRYVLGIVLEPDIVDLQGDTYDAETIRKAAWLYMMEYRNIGLQHQQLINHATKLVESYIAPVDLEVNGVAIKAGTWLIGQYVADDGLWAAIKSGQVGGLSIGGVATKVDPETGEVIPPPPDDARFSSADGAPTR